LIADGKGAFTHIFEGRSSGIEAVDDVNSSFNSGASKARSRKSEKSRSKKDVSFSKEPSGVNYYNDSASGPSSDEFGAESKQRRKQPKLKLHDPSDLHGYDAVGAEADAASILLQLPSSPYHGSETKRSQSAKLNTSFGSTGVGNNNSNSNNNSSSSSNNNSAYYDYRVKPIVTEDSSALDISGLVTNNITAAITCKCQKTRCLKLYCDCFKVGRLCEKGCTCNGCANKDENDPLRIVAMNATIEKNPVAFKPRVTADPSSNSKGHLAGCKCRKSNCLKKYCECFNGRAPCGSKCRCVECKNGGGGGGDGDTSFTSGYDQQNTSSEKVNISATRYIQSQVRVGPIPMRNMPISPIIKADVAYIQPHQQQQQQQQNQIPTYSHNSMDEDEDAVAASFLSSPLRGLFTGTAAVSVDDGDLLKPSQSVFSPQRPRSVFQSPSRSNFQTTIQQRAQTSVSSLLSSQDSSRGVVDQSFQSFQSSYSTQGDTEHPLSPTAMAISSLVLSPESKQQGVPVAPDSTSRGSHTSGASSVPAILRPNSQKKKPSVTRSSASGAGIIDAIKEKKRGDATGAASSSSAAVAAAAPVNIARFYELTRTTEDHDAGEVLASMSPQRKSSRPSTRSSHSSGSSGKKSNPS